MIATIGFHLLVLLPACSVLDNGAKVCQPRPYTGYASPSAVGWGSWVPVGSHGGSVTYRLTARALGNTSLVGQVRYQGPQGERVETFYGSVTIRTGNAYGNVYVRFQGQPLGSAVEGTISP